MSEHDSTQDLSDHDTARDRYHLLSVLGRGSTSTVYLAHDRLLDRTIALKVFDPTESATALERMRSEAHLGQELRHPNIVEVYGFERVDGSDSYALVLEHIDGGSCRDRLESGWYRHPARVLDTITSIARALSYAHGCGVIHRDVKPSNVLVADDGTAKLADFGVARCIFADVALTRSGPVGTRHYLAPEVLSGASASERSDIYSLGLVAKELWAATDRSELPARKVQQFANFIERCLAEHPESRPSAMDAVRMLEGDAAISSTRLWKQRLLRQATRVAIGVTACVLAVLLACETTRGVAVVADAIFRFEDATGLRLLAHAHNLRLKLGEPHRLLIAATEAGNERLFDALNARSLLPAPYTGNARGAICSAVRHHQPRIVERLLDYGVPLSVECKEDQRVSGLAQVAIIRGDRATRELLIRRGAFNLSSELERFHASRYAVIHLRGSDAQRIFEAVGARNLSTEHRVALIAEAARWYDSTRLHALLQTGFDLNITDSYGNSALHFVALDCEDLAVARLTELREVRATQKNTAGQTAADIACERGKGRPGSRRIVTAALDRAVQRERAEKSAALE